MQASHEKNDGSEIKLMPSALKKSKAADDWLDDVVCTGVTRENPANVVEAEVSRYLGTEEKLVLQFLIGERNMSYFFHDYLS